MSEPRNTAAHNLAGALYTGPGNEAPTAPTTVEQINPFSQRAKTSWYAWLEDHGETRERTSASEKTQFIRWCTESTMEKGLPDMAAKKRSWVKAAFHVAGDRLFRNPNKSYPVRREVISLPELFDTVTEVHNSLGHVGQDATSKHVLDQYFGVSKREIIELLRHCAICNRKHQSKSKGPLINIIVERLFQRVQIDLIDMRHDPDREFCWILHSEDHFSKFHMLYAMIDKEAITIARNIHHWITCFGIPEVIQSDNGTEFQGACTDLLQIFGIKVVNGRPRTPRTQGLVEQANGVVKKKIASWKRTYGSNRWGEGLEVRRRSQSFNMLLLTLHRKLPSR